MLWGWRQPWELSMLEGYEMLQQPVSEFSLVQIFYLIAFFFFFGNFVHFQSHSFYSIISKFVKVHQVGLPNNIHATHQHLIKDRSEAAPLQGFNVKTWNKLLLLFLATPLLIGSLVTFSPVICLTLFSSKTLRKLQVNSSILARKRKILLYTNLWHMSY